MARWDFVLSPRGQVTSTLDGPGPAPWNGHRPLPGLGKQSCQRLSQEAWGGQGQAEWQPSCCAGQGGVPSPLQTAPQCGWARAGIPGPAGPSVGPWPRPPLDRGTQEAPAPRAQLPGWPRCCGRWRECPVFLHGPPLPASDIHGALCPGRACCRGQAPTSHSGPRPGAEGGQRGQTWLHRARGAAPQREDKGWRTLHSGRADCPGAVSGAGQQRTREHRTEGAGAQSGAASQRVLKTRLRRLKSSRRLWGPLKVSVLGEPVIQLPGNETQPSRSSPPCLSEHPGRPGWAGHPASNFTCNGWCGLARVLPPAPASPPGRPWQLPADKLLRLPGQGASLLGVPQAHGAQTPLLGASTQVSACSACSAGTFGVTDQGWEGALEEGVRPSRSQGNGHPWPSSWGDAGGASLPLTPALPGAKPRHSLVAAATFWPGVGGAWLVWEEAGGGRGRHPSACLERLEGHRWRN